VPVKSYVAALVENKSNNNSKVMQMLRVKNVIEICTGDCAAEKDKLTNGCCTISVVKLPVTNVAGNLPVIR